MKKIISILLAICIAAYSSNVYALGECGYSCCLAGATGSGVTLAENIGLSLQYEYSYMETIKNGTKDITPNEVIRKKGSGYNVPTQMIMQRIALTVAYPATDRLNLMVIIPYIINDMDMKNSVKAMPMPMETVSGIGDTMLMGLYNIYADAPIRPEQRLTGGIGIKTPTGSNEVKGKMGYVHAMMQPGSGSWDPLLHLNYMQAFYPLVLQVNLFYHLTTQGDTGYEFGDQFAYDLIANYQVHDYINIGLQFNGIHTAKDIDHNKKYTKSNSMLDNTNNTGLDSILISPNIVAMIPNTGGSGMIKFQYPIFQSVNGMQQVLDWRILASITWGF
jgi:hypothetical protein